MNFKDMTTWRQWSEIVFIGSIKPSIVKGRHMTRLDKLQSYRIGCEKREKWLEMDKHEILDAIDKAIEVENQADYGRIT